jgi:hypothetical protein
VPYGRHISIADAVFKKRTTTPLLLRQSASRRLMTLRDDRLRHDATVGRIPSIRQ